MYLTKKTDSQRKIEEQTGHKWKTNIKVSDINPKYNI